MVELYVILEAERTKGAITMDGNNHTLLIVDDEPEVCEFVNSYFKRRGYGVLMADSGREAVSLIKENNPSVMVLDKRIRDVNGIDLLKDVRRFNQKIKVIMVSADALNAQVESEIQALNVLAYLNKPVVITELGKVVEDAFSWMNF